MNLKKTLLIIIFLILNHEMSVQAQENKILFKVNEEIITTLDIFNEIRYLESINEEFKKTNKNQAFEISKNSLIREKIKEIKLKELLDEVKIEDKIINNILINYFERLGIISIKNFNQYFTEKKLDPNDIKKKLQSKFCGTN